LTGAWAVGGAAVTSLDLAYIVVRPSDIPNLKIKVTAADPAGNKYPILGLCDYSSLCAIDIPPTIADQVIDNVEAGDPNPLNNPVKTTITATGDAPITWGGFGFDSFTQGFAGPASATPAIAATFDPATQQFSWQTNGSPRGIYKWHFTATNAVATDKGFLTVN